MQRILGSILALILAVPAVLSAAVPLASAEENTVLTAGGLKYELRTDAGSGKSYAVITAGTAGKELTIPAEIDGHPVHEIAAGFAAATKGLTDTLEQLTVGEGVRKIGNTAFANCTALKQVSLPDSLESIGEAAFANIGAEGLALPKNAAGGSSGFWYCSAIRKDTTGRWEYGLLSDGTAVITALHVDKKAVNVPEKIDGIEVTMVARVQRKKVDYASIRAVRTVTLPKTLKAIEYEAFAHFAAMTTIELPKSVESIGYCAFKGCEKLTGITLPKGVTRIGEEAFCGCSRLSVFSLPASLETIGRRAFTLCSKQTEVKLPDRVRTVGEQAFANCPIKTLKLNEGLESIGAKAFYAHKLTEIAFPATLRSIGNEAFNPNGGKTLKSVIFKSSSTELGIGVFGYDDGFAKYSRIQRQKQQEVKASDYDKQDPNNWIDYYRDPDNLGQTTLTVTCYAGSTADRMYQNHVVKKYLKRESIGKVTAPADRVLRAGLYTNENNIGELEIPEGVEEIADYAFAGLGTLNKVTIASTVTKIGAHAFEDCIGLQTVSVKAKTMSWIGEAAFKGCTELTAIKIPDGIREIGDSTFESCTKLATVTMPKTAVKRIGDGAFNGCNALKELVLSTDLETIGKKAFAYCGVKNLKIPNSVKSIGRQAFYSSGLTSLKLPAAMDEIPDYLCAFSYKLENLTMPTSVRKIGKCAFYRCPIIEAALPEGLESIGEQAFAQDVKDVKDKYGHKKMAAKMSRVRIPASVKIIEKEAFEGNDALRTLTFAKNSRLEEIGENAFAYCYRLNGFTLPDSVRTAGAKAFYECSSMTKADLGNGITEIGDEAFCFCVDLIELKAPECLKKIGKNLLKNHGKKLVVKCVEGCMMDVYIRANYRDVKVSRKMK